MAWGVRTTHLFLSLLVLLPAKLKALEQLAINHLVTHTHPAGKIEYECMQKECSAQLNSLTRDDGESTRWQSLPCIGQRAGELVQSSCRSCQSGRQVKGNTQAGPIQLQPPGALPQQSR
jgi:hypothetical protein